MTKLTKELLDFIGRDEEDLGKDIKVIDRGNSVLFNYDCGCSHSEIFELKPENILNSIRPSESIYKGRLQTLRRKIGKKFKDFTDSRKK